MAGLFPLVETRGIEPLTPQQWPADCADLYRKQTCDLPGCLGEHRREPWHVDPVGAESRDGEGEGSGDGSVGEEGCGEPERVGDAFAFGLSPSGLADLLQVPFELLRGRGGA